MSGQIFAIEATRASRLSTALGAGDQQKVLRPKVNFQVCLVDTMCALHKTNSVLNFIA